MSFEIFANTAFVSPKFGNDLTAQVENFVDRFRTIGETLWQRILERFDLDPIGGEAFLRALTIQLLPGDYGSVVIDPPARLRQLFQAFGIDLLFNGLGKARFSSLTVLSTPTSFNGVTIDNSNGPFNQPLINVTASAFATNNTVTVTNCIVNAYRVSQVFYLSGTINSLSVKNCTILVDNTGFAGATSDVFTAENTLLIIGSGASIVTNQNTILIFSGQNAITTSLFRTNRGKISSTYDVVNYNFSTNNGGAANDGLFIMLNADNGSIPTVDYINLTINGLSANQAIIYQATNSSNVSGLNNNINVTSLINQTTSVPQVTLINKDETSFVTTNTSLKQKEVQLTTEPLLDTDNLNHFVVNSGGTLLQSGGHHLSIRAIRQELYVVDYDDYTLIAKEANRQIVIPDFVGDYDGKILIIKNRSCQRIRVRTISDVTIEDQPKVRICPNDSLTIQFLAEDRTWYII